MQRELTYRRVFQVAAKGRQLLKMNARQPTEVETMKKILIQQTQTNFLGGHRRRMVQAMATLVMVDEKTYSTS